MNMDSTTAAERSLLWHEAVQAGTTKRSRREWTPGPLSDRDKRILEFVRQWWKYAGAKEQAIRDLFKISGTRYYQILNGLIDDPAALAYDGPLVNRLRRKRDEREGRPT